MSKTKQEVEETHNRPRKDRWNWVERTIWNDRMLIALDNGVKGNKWFSLIDKIYRPKALERAWHKAKANKGVAGTDRVTVERFTQNATQYIQELSKDLQEGTFRPSQIRRVYIPKGGGQVRPLGIPTYKDRIVQGAMKMVIEPIWEREFLESSYGFRPNKSAHDAIEEVSRHISEGFTHIVDADIEGYFDNIPHDRLLDLLATRVADGRLIELIHNYLQAGILEEMKEWTPVKGTPQGGVISPLLANIYLHPLDLLMRNLGYRMVRYADDFVVLCYSKQEAYKAKEIIQEWMVENGLKLHPDKTRICNCKEEGQGFEFLGFHFDRKYKFVRKSSEKKLREKIREQTKRTVGKPIEKIIQMLNRMLKGWFNYFKYAQGKIYLETDGFIRRRLRAMLRKQAKRPGMGIARNDCIRWPNKFFTTLGLFSLEAARAQWRVANQSR